MGIAAKLAQVSAECACLEKDGFNRFHEYKFTSTAHVLARVNPSLARAGIAIVATTLKVLGDVEERKTRKGEDVRLVTVEVGATLKDEESGETATFAGAGSGEDVSDKAIAKAITMATKYLWITALSIEMVDEVRDDGWDHQDSRPEPQAKGKARQGSQRQAQETRTQPQPQAAQNLSPAVQALCTSIEDIVAPRGAARWWLEHRAELGALAKDEKESVWNALCRKTEGFNINFPAAWLKKAIAAEDSGASNPDPEPPKGGGKPAPGKAPAASTAPQQAAPAPAPATSKGAAAASPTAAPQTVQHTDPSRIQERALRELARLQQPVDVARYWREHHLDPVVEQLATARYAAMVGLDEDAARQVLSSRRAA